MYTKEKLESECFIRLYKQVGRIGIKKLLKVEEVLEKRKDKKDLDIQLEKESFTTRGKIMHYVNTTKINNNGSYLKTYVTKTEKSKLLDISLELGIEGFDYSTGEKYDRKQAKVDYTYNNDLIEIKKIEDEIYYNNLEELEKERINELVLSQKK